MVIQAKIVTIIYCIWSSSNSSRFDNKNILWNKDIDKIMTKVALITSLSKKISNSSIRDFSMIKKFRISIHSPISPNSIEVLWQPPYKGWMKCKTDDFFLSSNAVCGGIIRDFKGDFLVGFAENLV